MPTSNEKKYYDIPMSPVIESLSFVLFCFKLGVNTLISNVLIIIQ